MGAVRVRWSTLARWVGGGFAVLLAVQALPPLLRPPPPAPLAADIGLPRVRAAGVAPPAGVARVSPARALPARHRAARGHRRRAPGRKRPIEAGARLVGEDPAVVTQAAESTASPAPPPPTPAPPPAPPPRPADGSVEFMPH